MLLLPALGMLSAAAVSGPPITGFRPPSVPLILQSPLVNIWSNSDTLNGAATTQWSGTSVDMTAMAKVGAETYLLMGDPGGWNGKVATQTGLWVWSTQTVYSFTLGDGGLKLNMTFTSPLLTEDRDLLSRPAHYITFDMEQADEVELYFDVTGRLVMLDSMPQPKVPGAPPNPSVGPNIGKDRAGADMPGMPLTVTKWEDCWAKCNATAACHTWAASMPHCDGPEIKCWLKAGYDTVLSDNKCRVSGVQPGGPPAPSPTLAAFGTVSVPGAGPGTQAIHLGAATQRPLSSTNDKMSWGVAYLLRTMRMAQRCKHIFHAHFTYILFGAGISWPTLLAKPLESATQSRCVTRSPWASLPRPRPRRRRD